MVKKILLISLVCLGLTVFMANQVSAGCCCNPRFCAKWLKGSLQGNVTVCDDIDFLEGKEIIIRLFSPEDTNSGGYNPLQGNVICARNSPFPKIRERRIKKCRQGGLSGCLNNWLCKDVPATLDEYDNETPLSDNTFIDREEDCGEACCEVTLEIEFDEELFGDICGAGWNYVGFFPINPIAEAIGVNIPNKEYCPNIFVNVLQADECDLNGAYGCFRVNPIDVVDDYPLDFEFGYGYGGYGGYGGYNVCY